MRAAPDSPIQLAEARPGGGVPVTIATVDGRHWGREPVFDWLTRRAATAEEDGAGPVLVGIDFAFAHPLSMRRPITLA